MPGDLESGGRDVCMPERESDRDLYWGSYFRRGGQCARVLVFGGENDFSVCVCGGGVDFR